MEKLFSDEISQVFESLRVRIHLKIFFYFLSRVRSSLVKSSRDTGYYLLSHNISNCLYISLVWPREAYYWLWQNTPLDSKVMSWWDYGYQIAGMANRTTLVDNNTWNNSHIALVGKAMSSNETVAFRVRSLSCLLHIYTITFVSWIQAPWEIEA